MTIKLFYSRSNVDIPAYLKIYASRVADFLNEYERYSDGRVTVAEYDPKIDSEEEDWAMKYGIQGLDLAGGDRMYFGLVALAADQEETIRFLDPSREVHLEYDITRMIARVQKAVKPTVGIISGLPVFGGPAGGMGMMQTGARTPPWVFVTELKKNNDVREIKPDETVIDPALDLLVIVDPENMADPLAYAVDQYLLGGGKVMLFADPMSTLGRGTGGNAGAVAARLMSAWGVRMDGRKAVADYDFSTQLRTGNNQIEQNPFWLSLRAGAFNTRDMITAQLENMLLPVSGYFEKMPDSTLAYDALLQSSPNAAPVEAYQARFGVDQVRRTFKASEKRYDLAVKLRGRFSTAFPDGRPKTQTADDPGTDTPAPAAGHLAESVKDSTVILVADADMLFDGYYVDKQNFLGFEMARIFNDNLNFFLNSVEILTGSDALVAIRSRGTFERPFTRVEALEKKAQAKWLAREQALVARVEETNRKLRELENRKSESQEFVISQAQEAEIEKFHAEKQQANRELKKVRRNLRADIERLGRIIKFINIFLVGLLVGITGILYAAYRRRRSHRAG